jgi:hypothetical protein
MRKIKGKRNSINISVAIDSSGASNPTTGKSRCHQRLGNCSTSDITLSGKPAIAEPPAKARAKIATHAFLCTKSSTKISLNSRKFAKNSCKNHLFFIQYNIN